jgi:hypothetical protein
MPLLNDNQKRRLGAYITSRNGQEIPGTGNGAMWGAGCWSWALTGGFTDNAHINSASSIYSAIIGDTFVPDPRNPDAGTLDIATHINNVDENFPGCVAEFTALRANLAACRGADAAARAADAVAEAAWTREAAADVIAEARRAAAQAWRDAAAVAVVEKTLFKQAMMGICARMNGLVPAGPGDAHAYTLHMRTSRWFGWDHWGIGVRVLPGNTLTYIQKVPNDSLSHACNVMWDESMSLTSIGIAGVLQNHINVINQIPLAPVRSAKCRQQHCNQIHAWMLSVANHWHRCSICGTVWCPTHGAGLAGGRWNSRTRDCSQCGGRTELLS